MSVVRLDDRRPRPRTTRTTGESLLAVAADLITRNPTGAVLAFVAGVAVAAAVYSATKDPR